MRADNRYCFVTNTLDTRAQRDAITSYPKAHIPYQVHQTSSLWLQASLGHAVKWLMPSHEPISSWVNSSFIFLPLHSCSAGPHLPKLHSSLPPDNSHSPSAWPRQLEEKSSHFPPLRQDTRPSVNPFCQKRTKGQALTPFYTFSSRWDPTRTIRVGSQGPHPGGF